MPPVPSRARVRLVGALLVLSIVESVGALIPIPHEAWWPVRMVAREIVPWFLFINLAGIALTAWRAPVKLAIFVAGLGLALWPMVTLRPAAMDASRQFDAHHLGSGVRLAGPAEALAASITGIRVADIEPEVLSPTIHLYRAATSPRSLRLPIIIDIHGGSWQVGGVREDALFSQRMAARGYAVFAIDYRKAPTFRFPAQRDDVHAAVEWVRANAGPLGADPDRIALVGRSAGGHLAMLEAYAVDPGAVRSIVNLYGPGDLTALYERPPAPDPLHVRDKLNALFGATPGEAPDLYRAASPINYVSSKVPPTLHIQGGGDNVVSSRLTRELHARLLAAGARSVLLELPWADHSFDFVHFGPSNSLAQSAIDAFLAATLAPASDPRP